MAARPPSLAVLPIDAVLGELREALAARRVAVLQAPPGAGKTTRVPLAMLDEPWMRGTKIMMLEPRRVAARAAAAYMARLLGEGVGETVGYRVRLDTRVGPRTRIEVVTEGVLGRMLQDDPGLDGVGLVIFDEFHERSLHADLGLALTLQTRDLLRPDLGVLVMSATLDIAPVAALLGDAPVVRSEGRAFPVTTRYVTPRPDQRIEALVASTVRDVLDTETGDVLVFLPGVAEIRRVAGMLESPALPGDTRVLALHGTLPLAQQDAAIAPSAHGHRKVVLATSIAETSLTIEGVRIVIDSGLMRVPRFSPRSGMTGLETLRVSRASADQRRGRAGRTRPGIAYRLWPEHENGHLVPHSAPEILEADLAPLTLTLAEAGIPDPSRLAWLDAPPAAAYSQARELLRELGALDVHGGITAHGREMAQLPMHPRLAHMILRAPRALTSLACDIAALLGERDVLRQDDGPRDADMRLRLDVMAADSRQPERLAHGMRVDGDAVRRVREQSREWQRTLRQGSAGRASTTSSPDPRNVGAPRERSEHAGALLALAYPDRIAQRRTVEPGRVNPGTSGSPAHAASVGRFLLRNGRGAVLMAPGALSAEDYIVIADLDDQRPESRIFLAAPVTLADIEEQLAAEITTDDMVQWDDATRSITARRRTRLGSLILADAPLRNVDPALISTALLDAVRARGVAAFPWTDAARRMRERMAFMARHDAGWPDVSDSGLAASIDAWLAPHLAGLRRLDDVGRLDHAGILAAMLDWKQRAALDDLAPTHLVVPSGSRIPIDYSDPEAPVLAVRLQEMFGCTDTPRIAGGRVPLTVHLLSPAHRPVQVTRDLAGFWRTTYFDVRKDLRGRYPKHHWPDDPLAAAPTSRAKRRD